MIQKINNHRFEINPRDLPGDPVVKNPLSNAGDVGSTPGRGTEISHATVLQLERSSHATTKSQCTTTQIQHSQK